MVMRAPPMLSGWLLVRALSGFSISSSKALTRGPPLRTAQQRGPSNSPPFGLRNAQYLTAANLPLHAPNSIRKVFASHFRTVSQSQGRTCIVALPKFDSLTLPFCVIFGRYRLRSRLPTRLHSVAAALASSSHSPTLRLRIFAVATLAELQPPTAPRILNCSLVVAVPAFRHVATQPALQ